MAKKVIERILKVINILVNLWMGLISLEVFTVLATDQYYSNDDIERVPWIIMTFVFVNTVDYIIRKHIKNF